MLPIISKDKKAYYSTKEYRDELNISIRVFLHPEEYNIDDILYGISPKVPIEPTLKDSIKLLLSKAKNAGVVS